MKLTIINTLIALFLLATATSAQNSPILDTSGQPLRRGVEYLIRPAASEDGGPLTLVRRNNGGPTCPLYVGQSDAVSENIPVTFAPFEEGEDVVREGNSFRVTFSGASTCVQSTTWTVNSDELVDGNRLIAAGGGESENGFGDYFLIRGGDSEGLYKMEWCPADVCPICRFDCGTIGSVSENGQRLIALGRNITLPLQFERA